MRILIILLLATSSFAQTTGVIMGISKTHTNPNPEPPTPSAYTYYADDSNISAGTGTEGNPFQDPQDALDVMTAGQSLLIKSGTYRQTLRPVNSGTNGNPITITLESGAVVSGLNAVNTSWSVHSGNIYKTTIALPNASNYDEDTDGSTGNIMANQVFKNGVMQIQARYPNISTVEDYFDKTKMRGPGQYSNLNIGSLTDNGLPTGDLTNAYVSINGWFLEQTRIITSRSGNTLNYSNTIDVNGEKFRIFYYVTNDIDLLDAEKEWHYEGGVLYYRQTGGGSPTGVEFKARNIGFDLRSRHDVTITGGQFIGCDVVWSDGANIIVDGISSTYANHSFLQSDPGHYYTRSAEQAGIKLIGDDCILRNSKIKYASDMAVWLGDNGLAENNHITWITYASMFGAPFKPWNGTVGQRIQHNTSHHTGRGHVEMQSADATNVDISYNDFSGHNMLSIDGGSIYSQAQKNHTGTRIHHNWFHAPLLNLTGVQGVQVVSNYMDQAAGPVILDHNIIYDRGLAEADYYCEIKNYARDANTPTPTKIYNNTFVNNDRPYITYAAPTNADVQVNNIYRGDLVSPNKALNVSFSLLKTINPLFVGGSGATAYRLGIGSPGIDTGTVIPGITDGYTGVKPDMGGYESGQAPWLAGCSGPLCVD